MKRLAYTITALALTLPIFASAEDQSYISYDSGDTIVVQGIDNREIEVGVNSPVFAGDQVVTGRRGRVEIRLADGNIVALDNRTSLLFHSMQGSYESDDEQTVAELIRGKLVVHHTDDSYVPVRIDTRSASYHSVDESILSIETDGHRDEVSVFGGLVEVRTREGAYRLRTGERVFVGENGIYESSGLARDGMGDLERWYLRRSDDTRTVSSRYLNGRISYAEPMLDVYGSWVYVQDYGDWVWRPRVSVGWKPYHNGYWRRGRTGALVWVSSEPWGWVPYHYGRWAFDPFHGWVWAPGSVYAPAWVYWAYGPTWVGWVPCGYYDYYRPYHRWMEPRRTVRVGVGFGFWGNVHVSDRDLNNWVVVGPDHLVSTRVDRAALTTDRIRERLQRDGNRATFTDTPARFTNDELKNPADKVRSIARRAPGEGTGTERSGSEVVDATSFFRRDPDLSNTLRDRLVRTRSDGDAGTSGAAVRTAGTGDRTPGRVSSGGEDSGTVRRPAVTDGASSPTRTPAASTAIRGRTPGTTQVIERGQRSAGSTPERTERVTPDRTERVTPDRTPPVTRTPTRVAPDRTAPVTRTPASPSSSSGNDSRVTRPRTETNGSSSWRDRGLDRGSVERSATSSRSGGETSSTSSADRNWRETPVPGRVIDSIGGARLVPRGSTERSGSVDRRSDSSTTRTPSTTRGQSSPTTRSASPTRTRTIDRSRATEPPSRSSTSVRPDSSAGRSSSVSRDRSSTRSSSSTRSRATTSRPSSSTSSDSSSARSSSSTRSSSARSSRESSSSSSRSRVSRSRPDDN